MWPFWYPPAARAMCFNVSPCVSTNVTPPKNSCLIRSTLMTILVAFELVILLQKEILLVLFGEKILFVSLS